MTYKKYRDGPNEAQVISVVIAQNENNLLANVDDVLLRYQFPKSLSDIVAAYARPRVWDYMNSHPPRCSPRHWPEISFEELLFRKKNFLITIYWNRKDNERIFQYDYSTPKFDYEGLWCYACTISQVSSTFVCNDYFTVQVKDDDEDKIRKQLFNLQ